MARSYILPSYSREMIHRKYEWLTSRSLEMVLGDDLDSIMCATLMHHLLGWQVAGFYVDYHKVWHASEVDPRTLSHAVWLDLDMSREQIKSIGHHILLSTTTDDLAAHHNSVNPNLFRGVTGRAGGGRGADHGEACTICNGLTFPHKYPLGTIHFLLWLHHVSIGELGPAQVALLWLPDSSWINGQSHRFRRNVLDWVHNWIPHPTLVDTMDSIDTQDFERVMRDSVFPSIEAVGFGRGTGQVTSRHLGLGGHQCQFSDPNDRHDRLQALANWVADSFGWRPLNIPQPPYAVIEGSRNPVRYTLAEVRRQFGNLDNFVRRRNVFSYVIPNAGQVNYTVGISL